MKCDLTTHGLDAHLLTSGPRSTGLHMSDLYNDLYAQLEPARYGPRDGGPPVLKMAMGLAWETHLEKALLAAGVDARRPQEQSAEGVAFSPDLMIRDGSETLLGEIKLTWMAAADDLAHPKFAKWLTQAKAYCYHLGVTRCRFYVLFVNGSYRTGSRDPILRQFDVAFTASELGENWVALRNHGSARGLL